MTTNDSDELAERMANSAPHSQHVKAFIAYPRRYALVSEAAFGGTRQERLCRLLRRPLSFANDSLKSGMSVRELEKKVRAYNYGRAELLEEEKKKRSSFAQSKLKNLVDEDGFASSHKRSAFRNDQKGIRIYIELLFREFDRISEILDIIRYKQ